MAAIAIATGAHVRVGFEDSPFLPNRPAPRSNAEFVAWAVALARLHGREPATPAQARELLGLLPAP
jgi:3-keto-5-aminohexanoate cleavage enzyme